MLDLHDKDRCERLTLLLTEVGKKYCADSPSHAQNEAMNLEAQPTDSLICKLVVYGSCCQ